LSSAYHSFLGIIADKLCFSLDLVFSTLPDKLE